MQLYSLSWFAFFVALCYWVIWAAKMHE